jgi:hypothetical protein
VKVEKERKDDGIAQKGSGFQTKGRGVAFRSVFLLFLFFIWTKVNKN